MASGKAKTSLGFVKGHDFSRSAKDNKISELSPLTHVGLLTRRNKDSASSYLNEVIK